MDVKMYAIRVTNIDFENKITNLCKVTGLKPNALIKRAAELGIDELAKQHLQNEEVVDLAEQIKTIDEKISSGFALLLSKIKPMQNDLQIVELILFAFNTVLENNTDKLGIEKADLTSGCYDFPPERFNESISEDID